MGKPGKTGSMGHLSGLLYEATRNKSLNYIKHQKIIGQYLKQAKQNNIYETVVMPENNEHLYEELINLTNKIVEELPSKAKNIYKLNREEGLTYREIAEYLGISLSKNG